MKMSITIQREDYYHRVSVYKTRREEWRVRLKRGTPEYKKATANLSKRIKLWNRQIKKLENRMNKIIALGNAIAYFTGRNVKNSAHIPLKRNAFSTSLEGYDLAKAIFYKYGLENDMSAKDLREYVGAKRIHQPTDYRREYTIYMTTINKEAKQIWKNFCDQYNNTPITGDDFIDKRKASG